MDLLLKFKEYVNQQNLFHPKDKLLLAVSGGVDSVVLCELCKLAGFDFIIAHCNFQLRESESDRDEEFVIALGKKYEVEVVVKKFETQKYADENNLSIQLAARELRYAWFESLIVKMKSDPNPEVSNEQQASRNRLLTAHHANDNIETLLMNFFKGTGINGLHGILPKQGKIIRPLLFAKKEEITEFALINNLNFVEDSSNASNKYTRNYFRNQLIPDLQKVFPQVEDNLINNIERFGEIEMLYRQAVDLAKKKLLEPSGNEIHIPILKLMKSVPLNTIVYEIIRDYGFTAHQTEDTIALLKSETGKYVQSATHRVIKNRNWLIIAPKENTEAENILIEEGDKNVQYAIGSLQIKMLPVDNCQLSIANSIAMFDANEIQFPLLLRKWKKGDYFYPLGMKKKRKLSRFFTDQKLSLIQKEKTWVIEMNKKIIWVVGLRIDDRYKITDSTKNILKLSLSVAE